MVAAFYDNAEAVEVLISSGDEVDAKDNVSRTIEAYCVSGAKGRECGSRCDRLAW